MRKVIKNQRSCDFLENSKAVNILIALYKNSEPIRFNDLVGIVGGSATTVASRVETLGLAGIVSDNKMKSFPFSRKISLTNKGMVIAEKLCEVEDICAISSAKQLKRLSSSLDQSRYQIEFIEEE